MTKQNHERCERTPMEPHTIYDPATVVGTWKKGRRVWIIPGGRYTTSKARAEQVAGIIDEIRRVNG